MGEPVPSQEGRASKVALAVVATLLWYVSVVRHPEGGTLFARLFAWGGHARVEIGILVVATAIAATFVGVLFVRLRGATREVLLEIAWRTAAWALLVLALERFSVCLQSELVHFVQYGLVAFLFAPLVGPRAAMLVSSLGGTIDEVHQYVMYHGAGTDPEGYMDWNDVCLNVAGAAGGALPSFALRFAERARRDAAMVARGGSGSALSLFVLFATVALIALGPRLNLGHYQPDPYWKELPANAKPHHVLPPREGIPAVAVCVLFALALVDERRRGFPVAVVAGLAALAHVAIVPAGTLGPLPPPDGDVPVVKIPRATGPITVDGKLDEAAWEKAAVLELRDAVGEDDRARWKGEGRPEPEPTSARVLWDPSRAPPGEGPQGGIYVAFEVEDKDIWARRVPRDTTTLPGDEVVEVFLDVDGAGTTYYEVELSPLNAAYDLLVQRPTPPAWRPLPHSFVGHEAWDWKGMETAVKVDGEVEVLASREDASNAPRSRPPSRRWVAELWLPFAALKGRRVPPTPWDEASARGDEWRFNVNRVERPRPIRPSDFQFPELASFAPLGGKDSTGFVSFHRPQRWARVRFSP